MEYKSSFFNAVRRIQDLSANQDIRLIQLFFGVVGVPENLPFNAVQLKTELHQFCTGMLSLGPLRIEDVRKVCEIVRIQEQRSGQLNYYDSQTGIKWKWDSNPVALAVICELACQAAIQLEDQELFSECISLERDALKGLETIDNPQFDHIRLMARNHVQTIEKRFDVNAVLDRFDKKMPVN